MNCSSCPTALALALLVAGCNTATSEPSLDDIRKGAERYRDVKVAIAEGYTTDNNCVTAETLGHPAEQGAMGCTTCAATCSAFRPSRAPA